MRHLLSPCRLCPRDCPIDRDSGQRGPCGVADRPMVSRFGPSYSEERFLSGVAGSGMIWLTGCNMACVFCQNFEFNLQMKGFEVTVERLADIYLDLQSRGCHNLNWVTPTHQVPFLVEALEIARGKGLNLPVVYNCGGYEPVEVLRQLEGHVDIYLPDFKYWDADRALRHTKVKDYPVVCRQALTEMFRQVGHLEVGSDGLARRGLCVRHLLMPDGMSELDQIARWLAQTLGSETMFNPLPQYMPMWKASSVPELQDMTKVREFREMVERCRAAGLERLHLLNLPEDSYGEATILDPANVADLRESRLAHH